jgi:cytochrome c oxidase subunit 4
MTTVDHLLTDEHEHGGHEADAHEEHSDAYYVKVALVLAFITALETSTYWWPESMQPVFLPSLLIMMVIKFVMVVSIFMHLKFENKLFSYIFYSGLILAILVYAAALATFLFFSPT